MFQKKCPCSCGCDTAKKSEFCIPGENEMSLSDLPVGCRATIVRIMPNLRGRKKFADIGLVSGTELLMEAHAPFGGLLRVKVMESSMAFHRDDAENIVMKKEEK